MIRKLCFVVLGVTVALASSVVARSASAGTLYISANFTPNPNSANAAAATFAGPGAAPGNGVWNNLNTLSGSGLLNSNGSGATPVSYVATAVAPIPAPGLDPIAMYNGIIYQPTPTVATLDLNSVPAGLYDLYLYSQASISDTYVTDFQVNGLPVQTVTNTGTTATFVNGVDYTVFQAIAPSSGAFDITFVAHTGSPYGVLAGFQLVNVPEPSSVVLMGIGLAAASVVMRRRRM